MDNMARVIKDLLPRRGRGLCPAVALVVGCGKGGGSDGWRRVEGENAKKSECRKVCGGGSKTLEARRKMRRRVNAEKYVEVAAKRLRRGVDSGMSMGYYIMS